LATIYIFTVNGTLDLLKIIYFAFCFRIFFADIYYLQYLWMEKILTGDRLSNASIVIAIILLLASCWELLRNKKAIGLKKVTGVGWILIVFAILSGIISYLSKKVDAKEKIKSDSLAYKTSDSLRQLDNKPNTNKIEGIFRRLFYLTIKPPFTLKADVSQFREPENRDYQIIKKEFSTKGYW